MAKPQIAFYHDSELMGAPMELVVLPLCHQYVYYQNAVYRVKNIDWHLSGADLLVKVECAASTEAEANI